MPILNVRVTLTPAYSAAVQQLVVINHTTANLSINIQNGTHTYTSPFQQVGTLKHFAVPRLEAAIRITYTYDSANDVLTLYGNDLMAPDHSTCLLTRPESSNQMCQQHTYKGDASPYGSNPNWNYLTPYTPGLPAALTSSIRSANEAIITAAKAQFSTIRVKTPPPVLESIEEYHKWMSMHDKDGAFLGAFDPDRKYPEGTTMTNHLESTWGGEVHFNRNENIANVIGSAKDPKISSKPWIELWERHYKEVEDQCTSHNWASGVPFVCNDSVQSNRVGGHVIVGTVASAMPAGSDDVYIIPICKNHNNNDNVYMRANVYTKGIWLKNYLN